MELGLSMSLGDPSNSKPFCGFIEKARHRPHNNSNSNINTGLGFCMGLSIGPTPTHQDHEEEVTKSNNQVQLDLLPNTPVPRYPHSFPWASSENGIVADTEVVSSPSPNSAASSFQMDDEEGNARKKLRLSKEQSAFLEESFKEHNTLNPKQKVALAKQLKLRARQVEVWFQNRRARTKLKQTEVDCEYLKRCCDTLTQDNRRLQKEVSDLRALKTSTPFHMHLPATTLTMCPSCERVNFYPKT